MIMARKDERRKAAWEFAAECTKDAFYPNDYDGYESSCAQSHIAGNFITGANWADRTMVEKAIGWLKEQDEFVGISFADDFIERFKEAMLS